MAARGRDRPLEVDVRRDVGPPEPVDGLLRIPDDEEGARLRDETGDILLRRVRSREVQEDLGLQGVRVLELVDEKVREAIRERAPHAGIVPQQVARREEEVRVRERPAPRAPRLEERERGLQDGVDALVERELPLGEGGLDEVLAKRLEFLTQPLRLGFVGPLVLRDTAGGTKSSEKAGEPGRRVEIGKLEQVLRLEQPRLQVVPARRARRLGNEGNYPSKKIFNPLPNLREVRKGERVRDHGLDVRVLRIELEALGELAHSHAEGEEVRDGAAGVRARADVLAEGLGPEERRLLELDLQRGRVDSGFQRPFAEEERAEGVDRADREAVERGARVLGPREALRIALLRRDLLEGGLEPPPELRRRLARERDGRDVPGKGLAREEEREHPLDEHRRLAGPGARLDEERAVEVGADRPPGLGIRQGRAGRRVGRHQTSLRRIERTGSRRASSSGASRLAAACADTSATFPQIARNAQNRQSPASAVCGKEPEATREKRSSRVPSTAASDAVISKRCMRPLRVVRK